MPAKIKKTTAKKASLPKRIQGASRPQFSSEKIIEPEYLSVNQKQTKPYTAILIVLLIVAGFFIGMLYTKVQYLEKNQQDNQKTTTVGTAAAPAGIGPLHVAKVIGMDPAKFKSCLESNKYEALVKSDLAAGQKAGVNGTPTTFIDGYPMVGAQPYSAFKTFIDQELAKSQGGTLPIAIVGKAYADSKILAQANNPAGQVSAIPTPARVSVGLGRFPIMGNKNAPVTVVEFADFQCPFCERWFKDVEPQLIKDYVNTGKIKFAYRNYAFLGQDSITAAEGAYCANEQGKFWAYHDFMFNHQQQENSGWASKANLEE
ncbi:DsbA family protein [Patescibacteria group bacterium]|nr:DsbA family protein [Patescibacteria group bacterium]MCL5009998.1 DsbA family protein [Patescibacteria group bacterium]